ncbi:MAG: DUF3786 domain-containing protein [Desulfobulbaceae bacterium]|nr:DUF3786 domain-containing protein [Desulfobulbaceae bacterium]
MNPLEFIKFTPKTNCGECNHPTCLAFAVAVTKGGADPAGCPYVDPEILNAAARVESEGPGLEAVRRGQDERDIALVAHLKAKIRDMDFARAAPLLGAERYAESPGVLRFIYLGRCVVLGKDELRMDGSGPVDPRDQILLYNYVFSGGAAAPLLDWVGMESLPNSISKVRTLAAYCEQPLARRFGGRAQRLEAICRRLGAFPGPDNQSAAVAAIIPVLPRVPFYLLFWDEEPEDGFESRVKILFDRRALDFLDLESLVFSAERTAERILEFDSRGG